MIKFSIVFPTRNRRNTLESSLKTAMMQDYDNYEIIISDNSDGDETAQLMEEMGCTDLIKYFRTPKPLPMHDNYEFALQQVTGDYVIVLGDDDAILPNSLTVLAEIIQCENVSLVNWPRSNYIWKDVNDVRANAITLVNVNQAIQRRVIKRSLKTLIRDVVQYNASFELLPMVYHSAIHVDILNKVKARYGRIFAYFTPDVFSGFAIGLLEDECLHVGLPFTINGASAKSLGASLLEKKYNKPMDDLKRIGTGGLPISFGNLPFTYTTEITLANAYLTAIHYTGSVEKDELDYKMMYRLAIKTLIAYQNHEWEANIKSLIEYAATNMGRRFADELQKMGEASLATRRDIESAIGINRNNLTLDGHKFGVQNVFDVAVLASKFYSIEDYKEHYYYGHENKLVLQLKNRVRTLIRRHTILESVTNYIRTVLKK